MKKLILGLLLLTLLTCPLLAARKALVIGNSEYLTAPLRNPVNDARAMELALRDLGFEVTVGYNIKDHREMLRLILDFGAELDAVADEDESVGLFYYAGHGVQSNGRNYLIPTEANIRRDQDIELEGVELDRVLREMGYAQNDVNIIIMDACRNNPYASSLRSAMPGLAPTTAKRIPGLLIAYATEPDGVARDGSGDNGIYTEELLKNINTPGLTLNQILMKTRESVIAKTNGDQIPWENSSLTRDFYFDPNVDPTMIDVPAPPPPVEGRVQFRPNYGWIEVSSTQEAEVFLDGVFKDKVSAANNLEIHNVPVGSHTLELRSPHRTESQSIYVDKNLKSEVHFGRTLENMVFVEGGSFMMGSLDGDDNEQPEHEVKVSPFWIGKYEVTQAEYAKFMQPASSWTAEYGIGDSYPAYYVSWYAALKYCNYRSMAEGLTPCYAIDGQINPDTWGAIPTFTNPTWDGVVCDWEANGYRLPTEAEWEFAARGGIKSRGYKYAGANELTPVAWNIDNSTYKAHEIGTKAPNELGIYDMSGNVGEWCWDWYSGSYYSESPKDNPTGEESGYWRSLRGGDFYKEATECRVYSRDFTSPYFSSHESGFRVCRNLD